MKVPTSAPGQLALMLGALVLGTLAGELAGAVNLGTSLTVGVFAFAAALVLVVTKG